MPRTRSVQSSGFRVTHRRRLVAIGVIVLFASLVATPPVFGELEADRPTAAEIRDRAEALSPDASVDGDVSPPVDPAPADAPVVGLRRVDAVLDRLLASPLTRDEVVAVSAASTHVDAAWEAFIGGSRGHDLSHLDETLRQIRLAERALARTPVIGTGREAQILQSDLAFISRRIAADVLDVALRAGVSTQQTAIAQQHLDLGDLASNEGDYQVAIAHFDTAYRIPAGSLAFDLDVFEQNLLDAFSNQVGFAYSITVDGLLLNGGNATGSARTAADPPALLQSPNKEIQVASVSKTLTAILVLRLLDDLGLTPDSTVAPYLPSDWVLSADAASLTFRQLMTHTSGFKQIGAVVTYDGLETAFGTPLPNQAALYTNANFAAFRVLIPGLLGVDAADFPGIEPWAVMSAAYVGYLDAVYDSIGVSTDCAPIQADQTLLYAFPYLGTNGLQTGEYPDTCGGYGLYVTTNELALILTTLRYTEQLVAADVRSEMTSGFLGFNDPASFGWGSGAFGTYFNHGGDWDVGASMDSCVMWFPIQIETAIVTNSSAGGPHQCQQLATAFDNAWVPS